MSQQSSFTDLEHSQAHKLTRRQLFLPKLDQAVPWSALESRIRPFYHRGTQGRQPYPLAVMLCVYVFQVTHNLSDLLMEETLLDSHAVRRFVGVELRRVPDESTILRFRHLLDAHDLGDSLLAELNRHLAEKGFGLSKGTMVNASIFAAPTSTQNQRQARDPEMHSTRKGNQWHFGMKLHIGVDAASGPVHSLQTTAAHLHDLTQVPHLLHGRERTVWGDAGNLGAVQRPALRDLDLDWQLAVRPGRRRQLDPKSAAWQAERHKAAVRAKVEFPFRWVKRVFGYARLSYRGLHCNRQRLAILLGLTNLCVALKLKGA